MNLPPLLAARADGSLEGAAEVLAVLAVTGRSAREKRADLAELVSQGGDVMKQLWADPRSQTALLVAGLGAGVGGLKAMTDRPEDRNTAGSMLTGALAGGGIGAGIGYGWPMLRDNYLNELPSQQKLQAGRLKDLAKLTTSPTEPATPLDQPTTGLAGAGQKALDTLGGVGQEAVLAAGWPPNEPKLTDEARNLWSPLGPAGRWATGAVGAVGAGEQAHGIYKGLRNLASSKWPTLPSGELMPIRHRFAGWAGPRFARGSLFGAGALAAGAATEGLSNYFNGGHAHLQQQLHGRNEALQKLIGGQ
jgi:hypothetical protein